MRAVYALAEAGNIRGAVARLCRVLADHPEHARAHSLLGYYLRIGGDHGVALDACLTGLRLSPDDPVIHRWMSAVLRRRPRSRRQALVHAREALRLDPEDAWNHYELAFVRIAMYRPKEAMQSFMAAAERAPGEASILAAVAMYCFELHRSKEARDYAAKAYAADPGSAAALAAQARAMLTLGRHRDALVLAASALSLDATHAPAVAAFVEAKMCRNPVFALYSRIKGWSQGGRLRGAGLMFAGVIAYLLVFAAANHISPTAGAAVLLAWHAFLAPFCLVMVTRLRWKTEAAAKPASLKRTF